MSPIFSHTFEGQPEVALWQFANLTFAVTYGQQGARTRTKSRADAALLLGQALMQAAESAGLIEGEPQLTRPY